MSDRKLAYIAQINDVAPIPGYDRIEVATVLGWHCVVPKGLHAGDLGVYFEIDSLLPSDDPRFSFCEKYKYKVKTQRMCKGAVLSQGLFMPLTEFPELAEYKPGDDVTAALRITYYEPEDNIRKAASPDKYKKMAARHKELFKKRPVRWLMRHEWGKHLLFFFLGNRKTDRGWPSWVKKTDEPRCLAGKTKIATDQGDIAISKIVNSKLPVKVKSVNLKNGKIEYKPIVSYQRYKIDEELLDIEFIQENDGDTKFNRVICTKDHKFYVNGEYKLAKDLLVSDRVTRCYKTLPRECLSVLYGIMLGDGCVFFDKRHSNGRARFSYCQQIDHKQYFDLINRSFGVNQEYKGLSGYTKKQNILRFDFSDQLCSGVLEEMGAITNRVFTITEEFCNALTLKSIAVWYMDDGTLRHRDDTKQRPSAEISTNAFNKEENELLIQTLEEIFGIACSLKYDTKREFYSIYISADGTERLSQLIAPYVPNCMRYKLTKAADENIPFNPDLWETLSRDEHLFSAKITSIKPFIDHTNGYHVTGNVFDIEVADNHNFFANGVLTHNCQNMPWILGTGDAWTATEKVDGMSATYTIYRHHWPKKNAFIICSRNVAYTEDDENTYTEIARKYKIRYVLEEMLRAMPAEDYITIQGEIYGAGVQKRDYGKTEPEFMAFNLILSTAGRLPTDQMELILDVPVVPILDYNISFDGQTVDDVIAGADGISKIDGGMREGIVYRSFDGQRSFKAVSNEYLLKYH